jgi:hypothetical protein
MDLRQYDLCITVGSLAECINTQSDYFQNWQPVKYYFSATNNSGRNQYFFDSWLEKIFRWTEDIISMASFHRQTEEIILLCASYLFLSPYPSQNPVSLTGKRLQRKAMGMKPDVGIGNQWFCMSKQSGQVVSDWSTILA